jgi:hypothetical protein
VDVVFNGQGELESKTLDGVAGQWDKRVDLP